MRLPLRPWAAPGRAGTIPGRVGGRVPRLWGRVRAPPRAEDRRGVLPRVRLPVVLGRPAGPRSAGGHRRDGAGADAAATARRRRAPDPGRLTLSGVPGAQPTGHRLLPSLRGRHEPCARPSGARGGDATASPASAAAAPGPPIAAADRHRRPSSGPSSSAPRAPSSLSGGSSTGGSLPGDAGAVAGGPGSVASAGASWSHTTSMSLLS